MGIEHIWQPLSDKSAASVTRTETQLYLLAESQLLFWKRQDRLLLDAVLDGVAGDAANSTACSGASNGDRPVFYGISEAAVDEIGIPERRMIDSSIGPDDRAFLDRAQVSGRRGAPRLEDVRDNRHEEVILDRYAQGAILAGISTGAVQLGRGIVDTVEFLAPGLLDVFSLVPMVIDTHDEQTEWIRLSRTVQLLTERPLDGNPRWWRSRRTYGYDHRAAAPPCTRIPCGRLSSHPLAVVGRRG